MGMFDTVKFTEMEEAPMCFSGHVLKDFQTKDLDQGMDVYYIRGRKLYLLDKDFDKPRNLKYSDPDPASVFSDRSELFIVETRIAKPSRFSGTMNVYTSCNECDPVCWESQGSSVWGDRINEAFPWNEFELRFEDGIFIYMEPIKVESRDDVRLGLSGRALPDDDRIVSRHLSRRRQSKE